MTFWLDGLVWLLLLLGPLLILQRKVHFEIQALLLLLVRRVDIVAVLFSLLFLPGVFLHEMSHFIIARLVGVRTGNFSLLPRNLGDGKLQLGYVEAATSDVIRDSLIGAAPLLFGSILITYIAQAKLGFDILAGVLPTGSLENIPGVIQMIVKLPDFWLWFYLLFIVSSTMLPSTSDRRAWLPLAGIVIFLGLLGIVLGIGPWMVENLGPALNTALRALALAFGISALIHLIMVVPIYLVRRIASKVTGLEVR